MIEEPARVPPGTWREVGPFVTGFARLAGRVQGTGPPAVFLTLGRHHGLFWGWLHFAGRLMPGGRLRRRDSELVILRVASRTGSAYELTQHRRLGRRAGLSAEQIAAIEADEMPAGGWTAEQQLLLDVTDELIATEDLADGTWQRLREAYDERRCIEVVMLVTHYRMLATALRTLRVQPDRER